jgi:peptidoglycan hydrolase-like protein with peptidoglycan-binding domain
MARVSLTQFNDAGGAPRNFYNVDTAVGQGCPNRRDDVLLVQYFLRESFKGVSDFKKDPFPGGVLAVDGRAGPQTFAAIRHFQKVSKAKGFSSAQDGRVDPPVGEKFHGSISQTQYTILTMNVAFKKARPQDWPRVSKASDCPGELRPRLIEPTFI